MQTESIKRVVEEIAMPGKTKADKEEASRYTKLLYTEALLQEGILPDDPKDFAVTLNELLMK